MLQGLFVTLRLTVMESMMDWKTEANSEKDIEIIGDSGKANALDNGNDEETKKGPKQIKKGDLRLPIWRE